MFMCVTERSLNAIKTVETKSQLPSMADPAVAAFPGAVGGGGGGGDLCLAASLTDSRN